MRKRAKKNIKKHNFKAEAEKLFNRVCKTIKMELK